MRLPADLDIDEPNFGESRWIASEDVNVEHLLDVFTSLDPSSKTVWDACASFLYCLCSHKPRLTTLGPKIEALSDNHPSKPQCLHALAFLLYMVGNHGESGRLYTHTLKLWREKGNDRQVAEILSYRLTSGNAEQAEEALAIFKRLGDTVKQGKYFIHLSMASYRGGQLDGAEKAALRGIELLQGKKFLVCQGHRVLGDVYSAKREMKKAAHHFETGLGIATAIGSFIDLFWIHHSLAHMCSEQDEYDAAHHHIERAKSHANTKNLGRSMELHANIWCKQGIFENAELEASHAVDIYTKVGTTTDVERCQKLLKKIDLLMKIDNGGHDVPGELLQASGKDGIS